MAGELVMLLIVGMGAGVLSGLFGIGGGILMTPWLYYVMGRSWAEAVALSLFAIAMQSPLGVLQHWLRGSVDPRIAIPLAAAGLPGVALGDWLLPRTPVMWLKVLFAVVMLLGAYRLASGAPEPREAARVHLAMLLALGLTAGVLTRVLGIGGGLVTVPVLVLFGVGAHRAIGSSLVPVFVLTATATAVNLARSLEPLHGVVLGAGALLGVTFGVRAAHALPQAVLSRAFAALLIAAALYIGATSGLFGAAPE